MRPKDDLVAPKDNVQKDVHRTRPLATALVHGGIRYNTERQNLARRTALAQPKSCSYHNASIWFGSSPLVGRVNWKTAPRGTFALAHNRPACATMIERHIDNPTPKPLGLVV